MSKTPLAPLSLAALLLLPPALDAAEPLPASRPFASPGATATVAEENAPAPIGDPDAETAQPSVRTIPTPVPGRPAHPGSPSAAPPSMPGARRLGAAPGTTGTLLRPDAPLRPPAPARAPSSTEPPAGRLVTVTEDGSASLAVSGSALNRLIFPDPIASAYTATEAIDVILEGRAAIVTFRAARPADLLVVTQTGQFLLRLVPETLPAQTVRVREPRAETRVTASYPTQLADLVQAGYRRQPPAGFRTERPARPAPRTGALAWYLTLQHRGHQLTVQEYAIVNTGAVAHETHPADLARLFPHARAVSADPLVLEPTAWGRVLVVVDTDTLDSPEPSR